MTRHDCSAIAYTSREAQIVHEEGDNGTRATPIEHVLASRRELLHRVEEVHLRLPETVFDGLPWIGRELSVTNNELV